MIQASIFLNTTIQKYTNKAGFTAAAGTSTLPLLKPNKIKISL